MTLAERFKELAGTHTSKGVVWEPAWLEVIYDHLLAEQPDGQLNEMAPADTGAKQDDWLAECAEDWWVHQRGSTDTNRSRWALQYADRLIAAAKENATFRETIDDYYADAVEWRGKYNTERERNSRLERSNASNLKACDELKAKLEQTTASLIAECDEAAKLRADLAAANERIAEYEKRDIDLAARDKAYREIELALIAAARRCCG
jgi:hypothetical protein